jgi:histidinol-phosphate/aromatic aminotransferase/cobyric acid decarboxylase-like protein
LLCAKIPWNVNCLAQSAAVAALNDQEHLQKTYKLVKEEKAFLQEGLSKIKGFKIYPPDANFFFIDVRKTGLTAAQLTQKILSEGILIRDCTSFRGLDEYYIRIAVKQHGENVRLLEALGKVIKNNA